MEKVIRMRTIDGLFKDIHNIDPSSQISKNFIRNLVLSGKIKVVMAGNKRLANLDEVLEYLDNPLVNEEKEFGREQYGFLRKVEA